MQEKQDNQNKPVFVSSKRKVHLGYNVRRLRTIVGLSQDEVAHKLEMSPSAYSRKENKEDLDDGMLEKIAQVLGEGITAETIKQYSDEAMMNFIANTFNISDSGIGANHMQIRDSGIGLKHMQDCTIFPVDELMKIFNEKEQLYKDQIETLKLLLKSEQQKSQG